MLNFFSLFSIPHKVLFQMKYWNVQKQILILFMKYIIIYWNICGFIKKYFLIAAEAIYDISLLLHGINFNYKKIALLNHLQFMYNIKNYQNWALKNHPSTFQESIENVL